MKKLLAVLAVAGCLATLEANAQEGQPGPAPEAAPYQMYPYMGMTPQQAPPWMSMRGPGMGGGYGYGWGSPMMKYGWYPGPMAGPMGMMGSMPGMPGGGNFNLGPGLMMGQGMMQFGMGPGMIRGLGAMGYISSEKFQKFFDETKDIRKELNGLMFEYAELLRKPDHDTKARIEMENKIMTLRQKVYDKAPRYQWPF